MVISRKKYMCFCKNLSGTTKNAHRFGGNTNMPTHLITEPLLHSTLVRNKTATRSGKRVVSDMSTKHNVYERWHGAPNGSGSSIKNKF